MSLCVIALALVPAAVRLAGMFMQVDVQNVPVDRVLANIERELAEKPRDVELLVNLARVHAMAYASKKQTVPIAGEPMAKPPFTTRLWLGYGVPAHRQFEVERAQDAQAEAIARDHLKQAIQRYREALAIAPRHDVAAIGLGWALAQTGDRPGAVAALRAVVDRSWPIDEKGAPVMHGHRSLTEEAAAYLVPLLDPAKDSAEIDALRQRVRTLSRQMRPITPIAVPLESNLSALDIVDERANVLFDADGSGIAKRWTWIRPNAAWLVFDRFDNRWVTSALQFFGSVTFWLFWDNGYRALRALDDNGDAEISGRELVGLSLWHDRNSNGVSERGEVRPVGEWRIAAISCLYEHDAAHPDEIAYSPRGVTLRDGSVRPTFDVLLRAATSAR